MAAQIYCVCAKADSIFPTCDNCDKYKFLGQPFKTFGLKRWPYRDDFKQTPKSKENLHR